LYFITEKLRNYPNWAI